MSFVTIPRPSDDLVECPFEKNHQILRARIQTHIAKCSKSHPGIKKAICPFDSTHVIDVPKLKHHIEICDKKESLVKYKCVMNTKPFGEPAKLSLNPQAPVLFDPIPSEEWPEDNCNTYDPEKYVSSANVIRNKIGAQPAERREFRRKERERLKNLENGN